MPFDLLRTQDHESTRTIMVRKQRPTIVSLHMLHILHRYASSIGVPLEPIIKEAGLNLDPLANADTQGRIPVEQYNALWNSIATRAVDPNFGLHLGETAHGFLGGDILSTVMLNCPTVGDALEKFARYHDLATNAVRLRLDRRGARTHLAWQPRTPDLVLDRHHWEAVLSGVALKLRDLAKDGVPCIEVQFSHAQPADTAEHQRIFGCPVHFEQTGNALIIPSAALARPIFLATPGLLKQLEQFAQAQIEKLYPPNTWTDQVARLVNEILWRGEKPTLEAVARELAVSARYVQKKLSVEGTTYRALRDRLRKEIAMSYLRQPDVALCEVAFLLGFAEQSAFNHAFKRWTGDSPNEYRTRLNGSTGAGESVSLYP